MTLDPKWFTRSRWTLLEAAQIFAGIEPFGGGPPTDIPAKVFRQIVDVLTRKRVEEFYARFKDAVDAQSLENFGSRTGSYGNIRATPLNLLLCAVDNGLEVSPEVRFPAGPPQPADDGIEENFLGFTIDGAARQIQLKFGINEDAMRSHIRAAVLARLVPLVNPETQMPYLALPDVVRNFYDRIPTGELNKWFKDSGVTFKLGHSRPRHGDADARREDNDAWVGVALEYANEVGTTQWNGGARQITARGVAGAVAKKLGANREYWGQRGARDEATIRKVALKGWRYLPPEAGASGASGKKNSTQ